MLPGSRSSIPCGKYWCGRAWRSCPCRSPYRGLRACASPTTSWVLERWINSWSCSQCSPGFKVSRLQGSKVPRFQGSKVSRFRFQPTWEPLTPLKRHNLVTQLLNDFHQVRYFFHHPANRRRVGTLNHLIEPRKAQPLDHPLVFHWGANGRAHPLQVQSARPRRLQYFASHHNSFPQAPVASPIVRRAARPLIRTLNPPRSKILSVL